MLQAGSSIGPYQVQSFVGAGGMGEVYRARDPRLGRDVALKVLPRSFASDAGRQRRFEQEARAIARLNHPAILHIYDVGEHQGQPYLVTELLEGQTLRERLSDGALSLRNAIDMAIEMASGLAAAHDQGIVHRDLKPENLFITRAGGLKILDFGLAKLTQPAGARDAPASGPTAPTMAVETGPGMVLGTVGYMSPEQVRGQAVGPLSDIFAFGAILYEMLGGRRAFHGGSPVETLSAILSEEPAVLSTEDSRVPPALERIVLHCLEKEPARRFRSAHDLAFQLQGLSSSSGSVPVEALAAQPAASPGPATYRNLTHARCRVFAARFTRDGDSVLYSAAGAGLTFHLYMKRPESPDAIELQMPEASILAIAPGGEMAVQLKPEILHNAISRGTLATALLFGGAPRELEERVLAADYSPGGDQMLILSDQGSTCRIEYPAGNVVLEAEAHFSSPRISPDGQRIACLEHPSPGDDRGRVVLLDLAGNKAPLTREYGSAQGLAWDPEGDRVWFTAAEAGTSKSLYCVTLTGEERLVSGFPGSVRLHDIAPDGRALVSRDILRVELHGKSPGETRERDLSWLDWSLMADLTPDGRTVLFDEENGEVGPNYLTCIRKTDGSPVVRLGEGAALALSPDGRWALTRSPGAGSPVMLRPTGAGKTRELAPNFLRSRARWLPDSKRFLYFAEDGQGGAAANLYDIDTDTSTELHRGLPLRSLSAAVSPDGTMAAASHDDGSTALIPLDGRPVQAGPPLAPLERIIGWTPDLRCLLVMSRGAVPAVVHRVPVDGGDREIAGVYGPVELGGVTNLINLHLSSDGDAYAYSCARIISDLYVASGLIPGRPRGGHKTG